MLGIKRKGCVSNTMTNTERLVHCVRKRQLGFLGIFFGFQRKILPEDMFSTYHLMAKGDLDVQRVLGYDENEMAAERIATLAKDRCTWRKLVIACSAAKG